MVVKRVYKKAQTALIMVLPKVEPKKLRLPWPARIVNMFK